MAAIFLLISTDLFAQCDGQAQFTVGPQSAANVAIGTSARELATRMAQISSREGVSRFMKITPADKNPLMLLSRDARERFLESLTFNTHGLTGYRYIDLENELTPTQIARVLALFGSQENTSLFKKAQVKTAKDRRLLNNEPNPRLEDCNDAEEGGDYPSGGGVTTNRTKPPKPPEPAPGPYPIGPIAPQDYVDYQCVSQGACRYRKEAICLKTC